MDKQKKIKYWRWCCGLAIFFSLITFTPLIIPQGQIRPVIFGIPYSFWTSFIITVILVVLTYIGTRVHPGINHEEEEI
jgi:glucan phosphoethanolaminetransferase (alkaline phosphatase superfamily)